MFYQVTAVYQNSEIGYGEGESDGYAVEDCVDSIPSIIAENASRGDIRLIVRRSTGDISYVTSLLQYCMDTEI
jgi:hypothetical protein